MDFRLHHSIDLNLTVKFDVSPAVQSLAERALADLERWLWPPAPPIVGVEAVFDKPQPK